MSNPPVLPTVFDYAEEVDYSKIAYTAVVSDLHLCDAEIPNAKHPLWKKFKSRDFFFDEDFAEFVHYVHEQAQGKTAEIILNGDIFDFDSVTSIPPSPAYKVSWLESRRGLDPEREKSVYKIEAILRDHPVWTEALSWFVREGNHLIFVTGNHDLELCWIDVQKKILEMLSLTDEERRRVRFVEWFYISNRDTLVEHGHQYDPYCCNKDPINPIVIDYNRLLVRLPFGDLACRYLSNGMGFFNPHVDSQFVMSAWGFVKTYLRYMLFAQPLIMWSAFWSTVVVFIQTLRHGTLRSLQNPLTIEDRVDEIGKKANGTSRMVRELQALFSQPVTESPMKILKELWLDRAFLFLISLSVLLYLFLLADKIYGVSFYWMFVPIFMLIPPYFLYSRNVQSYVNFYKKPDEERMAMAGMITGTKRIIFGHTHVLRHEMIGGIEHLNPGTWSPAFEDVECTRYEGQQAFVWISPSDEGPRQARLLQVKDRKIQEISSTQR